MAHRLDPTFDMERRRDGRNVSPELGTLLGEAAGQRVKDLAPHLDADAALVAREPSEAIESAEGPSYYGMPLLKQPVWKWMIPAYFFTGGLAGACAVLAAAAQAAGGRGTAALIGRCRVVATGGAAASAGLLIADLGRPGRFLNMLRVFRPTSPMNMGTWILTPFGALAALSALPSAAPRAPRALARAADVAGYGAGVLGLPLVGYTGVLVANTAVPVWQGAKNTLPILFAFSGAVSAGGLLQVWRTGRAGTDLARRFGLLAKAGELGLSFALDREAAAHGKRVARPLHHGRSGFALQVARALVAASLVADLWPGRRRPGRDALAGSLALAGTLLLRFGIMAAGRASSRDPRASFEMQRRGRGAAEVATKEAVPSMPSLPGLDPTGKEPFDAGVRT